MTSPLIKWAGGKRRLLPEILCRIPPIEGCYFEPFLGGGAVFFALEPLKHFKASAFLSDANDDLMLMYRTVRDQPEALIFVLRGMAFTPEEFHRIRSWEPELPVERAARFIYLNKTCFNGLYRVNRQGKFNVPIGKFKSPPVLCDAEAIQRCSEALRCAYLPTMSFEGVAEKAKRGDFVYFDPPYLGTFDSYTKERFDMSFHERLYETCRSLDACGVKWLASHSDHEVIRLRYRNFHVEEVRARRSIAANGDRRGDVTELLISNYEGGQG